MLEAERQAIMDSMTQELNRRDLEHAEQIRKIEQQLWLRCIAQQPIIRPYPWSYHPSPYWHCWP